jgi:NhaP-type Na+/H+ or K+/H+ antiporter
LFGFGLFSLFGGRRVVIGGSSLAGAGALGTLVVSFTAVQKWNSEDKKVITRVFYLVWQFAQPVLFGLVGAALDISSIDGSLFGMALVVIICGLVLRVIVAVVVVTGNKFTIKEKIFIGLSWLPKATVQAALGSVPLDLAIIANNDSFKALGQTVLTVAVLAIVITAPLGAVATGVLGPYLLGNKDVNDDGIEDDEANVEGSSENHDEVKDNHIRENETIV